MVSTFRSQLILTFLGLVLVAEVAVAAAILHRTYTQTLSQANNTLQVGNRVLDRLMLLRAKQMMSVVDVLSSDFGFKSAVATEDGATLRSVLANFGNRAQADLAILADRGGQLTAAVPTSRGLEVRHPFKQLLTDARKNGDAAGLIMVNRRAYQFVVLPVRAPRLIAWVGMGFEVNHQMAQSLAALTGVNVDFVVRDSGQRVFHTAAKQATDQAAPASRDAFVSTRRVLLKAEAAELDVVLSLTRSTVLSPYYALARNLIVIFLITLAVSALIAVWLARQLSRPVRELSRFAEAIGAGAYQKRPARRAVKELTVLADTLDRMQQAVSQRETRIRHQATHDAMTGLYNREATRDHLKRLLEERTPMAVLRIAVHNFARINAALGYRLGDDVLKTVAARLATSCRAHDVLGRVEGNDFLMLAPCQQYAGGIEAAVEHLKSSVEQPIQLAQTPIAIALEVGVVRVPDDADDLDSVWRRTVIARENSRLARGQTFFYQAGLDEARRRELMLIQDLAPALARNELSLVYQPIMSFHDSAVRQVETLARWHHPTLGFVSPEEFIRLAEHSGQIRILTDWVVARVAEQLREWQHNGCALGVAINLSGDELAEPGLDEAIAPLLDAAGPDQPITLEVTESALLRDPEGALDNLRRMQARGAAIAIDDFGTGYSSLAQLKQIAADKLKIDKSFVLKLDSTPVDQFIVGMIIELGHKLGMEIVAEGVENDVTQAYLVAQGAEFMQGYVLAKPMPAHELTSWLAEHAQRQVSAIESHSTATVSS